MKAIIFDLDNTLLDRTNTFKAFAEGFVARYFCHSNSQDEIVRLIIELDEDGYKDRRILFRELLERLPWLDKPEHDELMGSYSTAYITKSVLMEQALNVIRRARAKYKTALITNGRNEIQYGKIDRLGIRDEFDFILVSEEAGCKKPDRRIFETALNKLRLRPEQCIYVGDHPVNDIEGALNAGMGAIWIRANQPWPDGLTARPLYAFDRISEMMDLLGEE
ncbi:HAD family hydrolase [Paenibacillus arenilitoris]|uniref:HAD family hydrolase n=1 Tax=Paenibacillus arenilitoris TaxID=2772299 RepID=UPI00295B0C26|nr:HAD family hydrolase [Paenibacillus arenilitoris]